jgi:cytochrome b pre-mRNA-processing protein 3
MAFFGFFGRDRYERVGFTLYGSAVQAARDPFWYRDVGVPDTLDGRFDMIGLYVCLLIRRLRALPRPGPEVAQAVFDAMFSDMDQALRELGVGDLSVGKQVRAMWEALHGRARAYEAALGAGDETALAEALARNVWRGAAPEGRASRLAQLVAGLDADLRHQDPAALCAGRVVFPQACTVAA